MDLLKVSIVQFVLEHQPNIVRCEFVDAEGRTHSLIDKVPIFYCDYLDADSRYPTPGRVRCTVLERWRDSGERELVRISTKEPDGVESTQEVSDFVVLATQIESPDPNSVVILKPRRL